MSERTIDKNTAERTEPFLHLQLLIQLNLMRNLLILLDQVEALGHDWVVFVLVLPNLHEHLNHILHPLADGPFVEDGAEAFEDECIPFASTLVFSKEGADLAREAYSELDRVVGWSLKEKENDLESDDFVCDRLVD